MGKIEKQESDHIPQKQKFPNTVETLNNINRSYIFEKMGSFENFGNLAPKEHCILDTTIKQKHHKRLK